jgi:Holliday junction resolvasome RuvABC endonuclease subunit
MKIKRNSFLLAVDPSLRQSGWALFDMSAEAPVSCGIISPFDHKAALSERLLSLHKSVEALFNELSLSSGDYVVCEGPAPVSLNPSSSIKVEQVRGLFEGIARTQGILVPGRLNPRTIQTELFGLRGKQIPRKEVKQVARSILLQMFGGNKSLSFDLNIISEDAIDAILIGVLARIKILHALKTGCILSSLFEGGKKNSVGYASSSRGLRWSSRYIS